MQAAVLPPVYRMKTARRFAYSFLVGLPMTLLFPFTRIPTPFWWSFGVPLIVYTLILLFAILQDPVVREGKLQGRDRTTVSIICIFITPIFLAAITVLSRINLLLALPLIPVLVGLVASFAFGGGRSKGWALFCGAFAWLGAALVNVLATIFDFTANVPGALIVTEMQKLSPGATVGAVLLFALLIHMIGIAVAVLGGQFGWYLRKRLLGEMAVGEIPIR